MQVKDQVDHGNDLQNDEEAEEELTKKYIIHDPNVRWDKMEPKLGDVFETPTQLKFCVTNYAVNGGYQIYFQKSDNRRIVARCGKRHEDNKCPFRLYAAWMYNDRTFQVKAMNSEHLCSRVFKFGSIVTPEWIGRHYVTEIENKPKVKLREMISDIKQRYRCLVRREKQWAKEPIEEFGKELLRSNPGSTCKVGVTNNPDDKNYFKRFYICFKYLSVYWKIRCRKVIGLDGCFLKGQVVVDVENKDNWTWFLELLKDDLDLGTGVDLVVISDQHKGLLESVKVILPHVEHRQCARHIYVNFNKAFSGLDLKKLLWACAMSCVDGDFLRNMEKIKTISPSAYEYLMSKEPKTWCRAYMSVGFSCEAVDNGISECFNSIIIRIYIMDMFSFMNDECSKWKVVHILGNVFQVRRACASYKVDLDSRVCSCRLWGFSGIPCVHAIAAINYIHQTPDGYISDYLPVPMPPKKIGRPRKCDVAGSNPHISVPTQSSQQASQQGSQPLVTSTVPTQPSQQGILHASSSNTGMKMRKLGLRGPSFRVGDIASVGTRSSEVTVPDVRRKKLAVRRPNRKSTTKFQDEVNNKVRNEVAQAPALNDVPLVNEMIEEEEIEVSVKVPEPIFKEVHLVNNQVPVVNDIPNNVAQLPVVNDVPLVNEDLKQSLDEVGDEIDQILGSRNASDASDVPLVNEGGVEPEFTEGHASDVLPDKVKISVEEIANLLEVGYSMAGIESMGWLEIELDDTPPVEMDLNKDEPDVDEGEADFVNDVLNDGCVIEGEGEGVENQDDGDVIEGEGVNHGNEAVGDVLNNEVADDGNVADDEGHLIVPKTRKRKPSERITKLKLKKAVFDKDGGGPTCSNPVNLE
uniref:SWIM-type domain-containing protein n=1 Tax=Lactuca sativa TaxID=4236 RepID=A0A9R1XKM3_LACSA|nr:hypothetical protein LSAT_V11C400226380 [Lactuca sativa]